MVLIIFQTYIHEDLIFLHPNFYSLHSFDLFPLGLVMVLYDLWSPV